MTQDTCLKCGCTLEMLTEDETDILREGERKCCCGSVRDNHFEDALCVECCGPHNDLPLHTGAGYYLISPR